MDWILRLLLALSLVPATMRALRRTPLPLLRGAIACSNELASAIGYDRTLSPSEALEAAIGNGDAAEAAETLSLAGIAEAAMREPSRVTAYRRPVGAPEPIMTPKAAGECSYCYAKLEDPARRGLCDVCDASREAQG